MRDSNPRHLDGGICYNLAYHILTFRKIGEGTHGNVDAEVDGGREELVLVEAEGTLVVSSTGLQRHQLEALQVEDTAAAGAHERSVIEQQAC